MQTERPGTPLPGPMTTNPLPIACLVPDLPGADAILPYLRRIDAARWYTNFGPLSGEFEAQAADIAGGGMAAQCVAVASGTQALECALGALDLPSGSRVLIPAFTFPATALAVLHAGHVPVLADVAADRWTLTPEAAAPLAVQAQCRAVIPVAALGCPVDAAGFDRLADTTGIAVLIDGAGALGAQPLGQAPIAFSLHATKPLGIGEGGLVATRDGALAKRVRQRANFGFVHHQVTLRGGNAKLSEYAAAVGLAQLARGNEVLARRDAVWARYRARLAVLDGVVLQAGFASRAPAMLAVRVAAGGEACAAALAAGGIESRRWYCPPLHRHPALADLPTCGTLTVTETLDAELLGLPFHAFLTDADLDRIVGALRAILR